MNIAGVRLFLEVADAGSLSKVATRRATAQSHISRQITDFETQCGGRLFHRTGRGVALTEFGSRLVPQLRLWLHETEQLMQEMRASAGALLGTVRLGIIPSAAHPLVTRLFSELQTRHPGIRLSIVEAQGIELDVLLDTGAVDLAVLFRFAPPRGQDEVLLCSADTYLVGASGDRLTGAPMVSFDMLEGLRLVLPRAPSPWREALDEAARSLGFKLQVVAEADSLSVQKQLVAHNLGLHSVLGPYSMHAELSRGELQASRLVNPDLHRHVALAYPRHGKLSAASREVADILQKLVKSWGDKLNEPFAPARLQTRTEA
ncbi:MAG: LysR family transcriptional regulator [Comamonadaceae bacterium]|nr:LysR family transcriptional regulator [Comamonadaceae bacterium]